MSPGKERCMQFNGFTRLSISSGYYVFVSLSLQLHLLLYIFVVHMKFVIVSGGQRASQPAKPSALTGLM